MEPKYRYHSGETVLEVTQEGAVIQNLVDPRSEGKYGYKVTTQILSEFFLEDFEFMKAVLFDLREDGPLSLYQLDNSDDYFAFADDLQLTGGSLALHIIQYGVLDRNNIHWDVLDLQDYNLLCAWGLSEEVVKDFFQACEERNAANIKDKTHKFAIELLKVHAAETSTT